MQRENEALMISNLALLLAIFRMARMAVKGLKGTQIEEASRNQKMYRVKGEPNQRGIKEQKMSRVKGNQIKEAPMNKKCTHSRCVFSPQFFVLFQKHDDKFCHFVPSSQCHR